MRGMGVSCVSEERRPESFTEADRPTRAKLTSTEVLDGEAVVYVEGTHALHVLNPIASLIWQNLDGGVAVGELAAMLSETFAAPYDVVLADVLATADSFAARGLLEGVPATEPVQVEGALPEVDVVPGTDLRFLPEPPHG
jgi:hypothetical protein